MLSIGSVSPEENVENENELDKTPTPASGEGVTIYPSESCLFCRGLFAAQLTCHEVKVTRSSSSFQRYTYAVTAIAQAQKPCDRRVYAANI
jgi:hypothetical protein